jgi:hypothetical protein
MKQWLMDNLVRYEGAMPDNLLSVAGGSMWITEVFD